MEVHNSSAEIVDIHDWYLTDDADDLTKWRITKWRITTAANEGGEENKLAPGQYRMTFAAGKRRADLAAELHTNFRLNRNGESLSLVEPNGMAISHQHGFPEQPSDVSLSLWNLDLAQQLFSEYLPMPGQANGEGFLGFVADTTFDDDPQSFHERSFAVRLLM